MAVNNDTPDLSVFGRGKGGTQLPAGYVDETGRVFNHVYMREMTGVEDDIMDDDELNLSERISRVLANCTEKMTTNAPGGPTAIEDRAIISAAVSDNLKSGLSWTVADRMAALLYVRRLSVGNIYKFDRKCPECGFLNKNRQVDLADLKVNYCKDATKRRVSVPLVRSGKTAVLKVISAAGERRIAEMRPTMKDVKSAAILARMESFDGKPLTGDNKVDLDMIKGLPLADRRKLVSTFNLMEGSIETEIELKCGRASCATEFKFDLDLGQIFFSNPESEVKAEDLSWV